MARCRFVQPETTRLTLSDGDWIEVKKKLTVGEQRAAFQQIVGEVNQEGWRRPNMKMMGLAEVAAYIVDWSFRDAADKPVPFSVSALEGLDTESYDEIDAAVEAHIKAMEAEKDASKKSQAGNSASETTSPSVA